MINLYLYNKTKKILGFAFYLFENEKYVTDHDTYEDTVEMDRYFESSKCDIIGINMERFISFCNNNIQSRTIITEEAIESLKKATKWRAKNKHRYNDFIKLVLRGESKMTSLVNSMEEEQKIKAYMMYKVLIDFVKKENL